MEEEWCKGDETLGSEPVSDVFHLLFKPPPLLNHDDAWHASSCWKCEVAGYLDTVAREDNHPAHRSLPFPLFTGRACGYVGVRGTPGLMNTAARVYRVTPVQWRRGCKLRSHLTAGSSRGCCGIAPRVSNQRNVEKSLFRVPLKEENTVALFIS